MVFALKRLIGCVVQEVQRGVGFALKEMFSLPKNIDYP